MNELYIKLIAAIAPAVVLAFIMIRRDKSRPEPMGWLLAATGLGVLSGLGAIALGLMFPQFEVSGYTTAFLASFVDAAIPEELLKLAMLCFIVKKCKHFDEYFDGIVYAVCVGMGFAGFENILYLFGNDGWFFLSISRALLSVPAHYFFTVAMGTFVSLAYFDKKNRPVYMFMAILIPVVLHGLYDTFCFSMAINEEVSGYVLIAFLVGLRWLRKYAKQMMQSLIKLDSYGLPTRE